MATFNLW